MITILVTFIVAFFTNTSVVDDWVCFDQNRLPEWRNACMYDAGEFSIMIRGFDIGVHYG